MDVFDSSCKNKNNITEKQLNQFLSTAKQRAAHGNLGVTGMGFQGGRGGEGGGRRRRLREKGSAVEKVKEVAVKSGGKCGAG